MARAVKPAVKEDIRQLTGAERSAVLMLALGEEHGQQLWQMMDEDEIKEVSQLMSNLGTVSSAWSKSCWSNSSRRCPATGSLMGSYESTERLMSRIMPEDKVARSWRKSAVRPAAPCGTSSPT